VEFTHASDGLAEADDQMRRVECGVWWMSRRAIAAVLARTDLASGERLVALSLASFAGRENRAWPGAPAASARAGLSRSRYQQARKQLIARELVAVEERATGRGRAVTITLVFADTGPWWDGDINIGLFERVLAYSAARGPERLLLATMAAVADERGEVRDLSTERLCAAAGIADRTYRRARAGLLASGQLELISGAGGRGNTNVWMVRDPRGVGCVLTRPPRRVSPPAGARPLVASARASDVVARHQERASKVCEKGGQDRTLTAANSLIVTGVSAPKGRQDRTVSREKCPVVTGVSAPKGGQDRTVSPEKCPVVTGVSGPKGGQDRTLFEPAPLETPAQTPAKTPAETPAANARAGTEPLNPRIREDPPSPPEGGSPPHSIVVEETCVTARGRRRRRSVRVDLAEVRRGLAIPGVTDRQDWEQIRQALRELVGESTFEIWLDPLELIAIDPAGALVIDAPSAMLSWLRHRYEGVLGRCTGEASRRFRFAEEPEHQAFAHRERAPSSSVRAVDINQREVS
jgi:hypothetical protein